jgi:hypothetical protein
MEHPLLNEISNKKFQIPGSPLGFGIWLWNFSLKLFFSLEDGNHCVAME